MKLEANSETEDEKIYADLVRTQNRLIENCCDELRKISEKKALSRIERVLATGNFGALFLGVVLSTISIYNLVFVDPETARIANINQFNQSVASATKLMQDMMVFSIDNRNDTRAQHVMEQEIKPQILDDVATANALMADMKKSDIGIPQLMVLFDAAELSGDTVNAKKLVDEAVATQGTTIFLHLEAERYQARYFFELGDVTDGRKTYLKALDDVPAGLNYVPEKQFLFDQLSIADYAGGSCALASADTKNFFQYEQSTPMPQTLKEESAQSYLSDVTAFIGYPCAKSYLLNAIPSASPP